MSVNHRIVGVMFFGSLAASTACIAIMGTGLLPGQAWVQALESCCVADGHLANPQRLVSAMWLAPIVVTLALSALMFARVSAPTSLSAICIYGVISFLHLAAYLLDPFLIHSAVWAEEGLAEWTTIGVSSLASLFFLIAGYRHSPIYFVLAILWLILTLEEISWGQKIFGYQSIDFFILYNTQQETNLHNFLPLRHYYYIYIIVNVIQFSILTWLRAIPRFRGFYKISGVATLVSMSDRRGLWLVPLGLSVLALFGNIMSEYIEEQWALFGLFLGGQLIFANYPPALPQDRREV